MKKYILLFTVVITLMNFQPHSINLIPETPNSTPVYWCTWNRQNFEGGTKVDSMEVLAGAEGATKARQSLDEQLLFSPQGWAMNYFSSIKKDMIIVLDDGWDVPLTNFVGYFGSIEIDSSRFPSFKGNPEMRLKQLVDKAKTAGWRGVGLWICAQEYPNDPTRSNFENPLDYEKDYWEKRLTWSKNAGIMYWKIDWGQKSHSLEFRKMITQMAKQIAPGLIVEQTVCISPLNYSSENKLEQNIIHTAFKQFEFAEVFRTYDVTNQLSIPSTLERVSEYLKFEGNSPTILNCEDEPYIAAALGCVAGIMRFPADAAFIASHPSYYFNSGKKFTDTRNFNQRIDEVIRLTHWQKLMPAFAITPTKNLIDDSLLTDTWYYKNGETWDRGLYNKTIKQVAPARISRNMPLPVVKCKGMYPFVVASKHPNGTVAVATFGRVSPENGYKVCKAAVEIQIEKQNENTIGIFGFYQSLTLNFDKPIKNVQVFAQDLAGKEAVNITKKVTFSGNNIIIPEKTINNIGLASASNHDSSEPGLIVVIR